MIINTVNFSQSDLANIVKQYILPNLNQYKIFTFTGPLGVGKTTLIKEILKQCGVQAVITSPTFSYVNTYQNAQMQTFHHFDLYRIDHIEEFMQAGFDEILAQKNSISFIEWPDVIDQLLKTSTLKPVVCSINLEYDQINQKRRHLRMAR